MPQVGVANWPNRVPICGAPGRGSFELNILRQLENAGIDTLRVCCCGGQSANAKCIAASEVLAIGPQLPTSSNALLHKMALASWDAPPIQRAYRARPASRRSIG